MRKSCKRFLALVLTLALSISMVGQAIALEPTSEVASVAAAQTAVTNQRSDSSPALFGVAQSDYLKLNKPKDNAVYYRGEKIPVSITIASVGDDCLACTAMAIGKANSENELWSDYTFEDGGTYKTSISTKKFPAGSYLLIAATAVVNLYSEEEDTVNDVEESMVYAELTLKTLKAPTSLKASVGKRKVTLSYKKASGATKYEIYRSTKKSSGYKKIATTTKTKYVDQKVKKGKKYYYKVRTVRTGNGTVRSAFTSPKYTAKVK